MNDAIKHSSLSLRLPLHGAQLIPLPHLPPILAPHRRLRIKHTQRIDLLLNPPQPLPIASIHLPNPIRIKDIRLIEVRPTTRRNLLHSIIPVIDVIDKLPHLLLILIPLRIGVPKGKESMCLPGGMDGGIDRVHTAVAWGEDMSNNKGIGHLPEEGHDALDIRLHVLLGNDPSGGKHILACTLAGEERGVGFIERAEFSGV